MNCLFNNLFFKLLLLRTKANYIADGRHYVKCTEVLPIKNFFQNFSLQIPNKSWEILLEKFSRDIKKLSKNLNYYYLLEVITFAAGTFLLFKKTF